MVESYDTVAPQLREIVRKGCGADEFRVVVARDDGYNDAGKVILHPDGSFSAIGIGKNDTFTTTSFGLEQRTEYESSSVGLARPDSHIEHGTGEDVVGFIKLATQRIRAARELNGVFS